MPALAHLVDSWESDLAFNALAASDSDHIVIQDAARASFLAALARQTGAAVLAVVPGEQEAEELANAASEFGEARFLPAWDVLPYERMSPEPHLSALRIEALRCLAKATGPRVVVAGVRGFIQKPAPGSAALEPIKINKGEALDREGLTQRITELGYEREDVAAEPGTFAVRGSTVDVYGAQGQDLVRIEIEFDVAESIRIADPETQLSKHEVGSAEFVATREVSPVAEIRNRAQQVLHEISARRFYETDEDFLARLAEGAVPEGTESILPMIWNRSTDALRLKSEDTLVVFDEKQTGDEASSAVEQEEQLAALWSDPDRIRVQRSEVKRNEQAVLYRPLKEVIEDVHTRRITAGPLTTDAEAPASDARGWDPGLNPGKLLERCRELKAKGYTLVFCAHKKETVAFQSRLAEEELAGSQVVESTLKTGYIAPAQKLAVITHSEWHARPNAPVRSKIRRRKRTLEELTQGGYVVHALHGIGRYSGMEVREVAGFTREYLVVEYAGGDKLFVPSDTTESLQRYLGAPDPNLNRLGTTDWQKTKARVKRKARDIAAELIRLYSARLNSPGHSYQANSPWQRELDESFPFEETPDQMRAIEDVIADLARPVPMDRLICGDVGYGKTEVAVRAAFAAVVDSKQVAFLVPTTLLAQQHFATLSERFEAFPVRIGLLSRFATPQEQKVTLEALAAGKIDVVVGTHRLLSADVKFADLGLIIVDEEHRFGVSQKEKLRKLRVETDVLTLTATPIPRTLEMSMSGIRDLSTIETAPAARRPIRTFVGPFDERLITAAIRRELSRGGQVFYVHNRVRTIGREQRRLERLVPEATIAVGHGQTDSDELEATMLAFWHREIDILLCTTIIEAGLDIPTSNTLIVDHADKLGLAQLYQLRGRVGRAGEQAYAYLFYPENLRLTQPAHERLKTLATHTALGSGMAIALKDLEIRGAGNLLGAEQHGHIESVGFEMYIQILEEAAKELKGEAPDKPLEVRIDLPVDAYLPESYIDLEALRLAAYRRIADTVTHADVTNVAAELRDRFGPLPSPAETLIKVADLRATLRELGISEVGIVPHELHGRVAKLRPLTLPASAQVRLRRLHPKAVYSEVTSTLLMPAPDLEGPAILQWTKQTATLFADE